LMRTFTGTTNAGSSSARPLQAPTLAEQRTPSATENAAVGALGLVALAAASTLTAASIAYVAFGVATNAFLSLHSGQTLRVLPSPKHRGRDLGLFNLTNTIPSLIMPWLTILLVPRHGFSALFLLLSLLAICSAAMLFKIRRLV